MHHRPLWILNTLAVWRQYLLLLIAAIPSALLGLELMRRGVPEQRVLLICICLTMMLALAAWGFLKRKSRRGVDFRFDAELQESSLFFPDFAVERFPPLVSKTRVPKILIISSDTGGGQRSAAAAVIAGIHNFVAGDSYMIHVIRAIEEEHHITAKLVATYNWLLRNRQRWMKYVYWARGHFRILVSELFEKWCPHVVVSVHPLTQHMIARVLRELGLAERIPLVTIVTDPYYGFWKGWACDDVSLYLVPTADAQRQLIDYGIPRERIKISGMPIHPKFAFPDEFAAQTARRALGLDPEKFTVFVNAGWEGDGNIAHIFRELVHGELDVQAIFLAGKNEGLKNEAQSIAAESKFPIKVIGYSNEVEQLMRAANVMISKLGGYSTFEALACGLPIIADATTQPVENEMETANLIEKRGAGILLKHPRDVVTVVRRMEEDAEHYSAMRTATITFAIPNATRRIVEEIVAFLPRVDKASEEPLQSAGSRVA